MSTDLTLIYCTMDTEAGTAAIEAQAGVPMAMFELNWASFEPRLGVVSASYLSLVAAVALPGAGVGQAFADLVFEVPGAGGSAHAAVTPAVLRARVLRGPGRGRTSQPPPLPDPFSPEPAGPTSAEPFLLDLSAALLFYGSVVIALTCRRSRAAADGPGPGPGGTW